MKPYTDDNMKEKNIHTKHKQNFHKRYNSNRKLTTKLLIHTSKCIRNRYVITEIKLNGTQNTLTLVSIDREETE